MNSADGTLGFKDKEVNYQTGGNTWSWTCGKCNKTFTGFPSSSFLAYEKLAHDKKEHGDD